MTELKHWHSSFNIQFYLSLSLSYFLCNFFSSFLSIQNHLPPHHRLLQIQIPWFNHFTSLLQTIGCATNCLSQRKNIIISLYFSISKSALEGGDSSNNGEAVAATDTPASKPLGKRPVESVEGLDAITIEFGEGSATKEPKMVCVKAEDLN